MKNMLPGNCPQLSELLFILVLCLVLPVCVLASITTTGQVTNEDNTVQWDWNTNIPGTGSYILVGYDSSGTLVMSGNSTALNFYAVSVAGGDNTTGSFTMRDGASVIQPYYKNHYIYVASGIDSQATMTLKGNGTLLRLSDHIYVGLKDGSEGELIVEDGAVFEFSEQYIGHYAGSYGKVTVDGLGSQMLTWVNNKYLRVGYNGTGELIVSNGGYVRSDGDTVVGYVNGSRGTVLVAGAESLWSAPSSLIIGRGAGEHPDPAKGVLILARGGKVEAGTVDIGTSVDQREGTLDFVIGKTGAGSVNCGLLETPSLDLIIAELEMHVDPGVNLTVGTQYTLVDYATLGSGSSYRQFIDIAEGDIYTSPRGYHFRINYATDLGGGDLGITATVTELPPCVVDGVDLFLLTSQWLNDDCDGTDWCDGADLDYNESVDMGDFAYIGLYWMSNCPVDWPWQ